VTKIVNKPVHKCNFACINILLCIHSGIKDIEKLQYIKFYFYEINTDTNRSYADGQQYILIPDLYWPGFIFKNAHKFILLD
jgi:hypothetical protein